MTWTYTPAILSTSELMQVRLLVGDTVSSDQMLQDEEIQYAITQRATVYGAAANCCRNIASSFSRQVDSSIDVLRASFSQKYDHYMKLAIQYDNKAAETGSGSPFAGGVFVADKQNTQADQSLVKPQFNLGMDTNQVPVPPVGNETEDAGP